VTSAGGAGIDVALRRVVVGYRVVGVVWLWLLAAVVLATETVDVWPVVGAGALATLWSGATVVVGVRRPTVFQSISWLTADAAVSGLVIALATVAGAERGFVGGYPFSTVLLASYGGGLRASLPVAAYLSAVSFFRLGAGDAIGSALIYVVGAAVTAWGMGVLARNEDQRRSLEQRLADERTERLRSQERAETAATLHDGVLQTLALIQRRAADPAAVAGLARRQERDLRDWLSGRTTGSAAATLAGAIKNMAAVVEEDHNLTVEVVTVGDADQSPGVDALITATAEALRNVAKHAGVATASVYAEVGADSAAVFVRDRGAGFDPATVPADRRGISESIVGRMRRHGGSAEIRSVPGTGTEVILRVPLTSDDT
jgi:signal transduction histidine kinase